MPGYKATLTSVGDVNNSYIYLEIIPTADNPAPMPIFLSPKGTNKKSWSNNNINVQVNGLLDYDFRVHAFKGTSWTFKLINKSNNKEVISFDGTTGEIPENGNNISIKRGKAHPGGMPASNNLV